MLAPDALFSAFQLAWTPPFEVLVLVFEMMGEMNREAQD
jgi:hypothetical protein